MGLLAKIAPKVFADGIDRANRLALSLVEKKPVGRLLDAGCGAGALTLEFARQLDANEVLGIEFIDSERKQAEERGIKCKKFDLNDKWQCADNSCDVIISSMNLEHMHNTRNYLEESFRCLKPGGQFLVITDNLSSWVNVFALAMGWQPFSTTLMNGWSLGNPMIWHAAHSKAGLDKNQRNRWACTSACVSWAT
jgi:2-polyprenyl-3-methyl-5-hydroxy-6-metoxy-1,4-benzoquinol methylase